MGEGTEPAHALKLNILLQDGRNVSQIGKHSKGKDNNCKQILNKARHIIPIAK
jgi:hypothetical protein